MPGLITPKGGATKQTTSQTTVDPIAQAAQQNTLNAAQTVTGGVLGSAPQYTQAGINSDQSGAYDLIRQMAQGAANTNSPTIGSTSYTPTMVGPANGYTAQGYTAAQTGGPATYAPTIAGNAQSYLAALGTAAQTGPTDYQQFMSPYTQSVIDPAVQQLRRSHDETSANIGAQAAAANSFGGSSEAIRQSQNDRALGDQTSSLVGNQLAQAYAAAQGIAQANTGLQQQTGLANQAAQNSQYQYNANAADTMARYNSGVINSANQFNAGATNTDRQFNANALNTAGQFNAGANNTANQFLASAQNNNDLFNASAQNTAGQFMSNSALQRAQVIDGLLSSDQTRRMQSIQALLGVGNAQQTLQQSYLNQPLQYLQALAATTPQQYSSSSVGTAPNTAQSPLQALLGAGVTLGAAAL